ncbi:biopolymer transporter ExbD [Iodidimonas gelatinilytica]|uniref:Biopolymer transporter ExbD n=2 Tax=Iodidimonas TaxID=2066486 RepID=A0A5A7MX64_9PROT|nr:MULTISPECIES: biopolymer transporter ExbD [Iodidimonas]GEQ97177.1 biopolymer transporter ExbD [Iodidimonas gelatinilytica]GEQ99509.1 biopolymer transporter ExbD [Iodidimonas gelatinilytica]GER07391.1 biopolymer transporter ExbD [Kordiimonadales bacterium JCM 17843]GGO10709.1 biopolymer transporter ExbD [Iodidimonas muriae]
MRKFSKAEEEAEINMTPMLDIVFIMLIFFIVTASFVKESGLDVNKPPPNEQQKKDDDKKNILIQVDSSNRIFVNLRPVDIASVRANVERLHAENPEGVVVIQPAEDAFAGIVVEIYDQARQAGVYNVSIAEGRQ